MNDPNSPSLHGALTVEGFCDNYSIGRTVFYQEVKDGKLRAVKCRGRTLVLLADAKHWEAALPAVKAAA